MTEKELINLQKYIGKRNQGQSDEEVINHIEKINQKLPLSQKEWHELIIPCCNNGMVKILKYVLEHISVIQDIQKYMNHTVYGRNPDLDQKRIEVLKILMEYLEDNKKESLSEIMLQAGWFGETAIVKFLIESGADKDYQNANDLNLEKCAYRVAELFEDPSLKEYLGC